MNAIKIGILFIIGIVAIAAIWEDTILPHTRAAGITAASTAPEPAHTSMAPQDEYLLDMRVAAVSLAQAHAANMCQLRSDEWLHDFDLGYQYYAAAEVKRLGISAAGISEGDKETARMYRETMGMTSCRVLLNSQAMAHLDDMQNKMTGGYH